MATTVSESTTVPAARLIHVNGSALTRRLCLITGIMGTAILNGEVDTWEFSERSMGEVGVTSANRDVLFSHSATEKFEPLSMSVGR